MLSCLCFHVLRFYIPPTSERICDSLKIVLNVTCVCMCVYQVSNSLRPHGLQPARLLCPWDTPGKNTGVGCLFLLQGIFLTQGSSPCLLHRRQILYHLSHQGNMNVTYVSLKQIQYRPLEE